MKLKHGMILAAGLGTRMRPLTETLPKPLIPVGGKPLIDWCLDLVVEAGLTEIVVNTSYRAAQLETYLAARTTPRITISREEPVPLETGGGIVKALPFLGEEPFFTMNSDAVFPATEQYGSPVAQLASHWSDEIDFLMLLIPKRHAIGWEGKGDFVMNDEGEIRRPQEGEEAPYIFSGLEFMHPRVFEGAPQGAFSLSTLWRKHQRTDGYYGRIRAVVYEGPWLNVGDLVGLAAAERYLVMGI